MSWNGADNRRPWWAGIGSFDEAVTACVERYGAVTTIGTGEAVEAVEASPLTLQTETAAELLAREIPPKRWAVENLIGTGASVFAAPPKAGKSLIILDAALAVATGGKALGRFDVEQGKVLYLALEDSPRRMQERVEAMTGSSINELSNLEVAYHCPPLSHNGDKVIAEWLKHHRDTRLIIIDVFARFRGAVSSRGNIYAADYKAIQRIKAVADDYDISIVLVHHSRKAADKDFVAEISGTHGLAGAADDVMVLRRTRGKADGILHITGRDIIDAAYPLVRDESTGRWSVSDISIAQLTLGETRAAILDHVREHEPATPKATASALGFDPAMVRQTMRRMMLDNQLVSDGHGKYYAIVEVE